MPNKLISFVLGRFSVATLRGRSCQCASQTAIARSLAWTGNSAQPADTQNASGMACIQYETS